MRFYNLPRLLGTTLVSLTLIACNNGGSAPDSPKSAQLTTDSTNQNINAENISTQAGAIESGPGCVKDAAYFATHHKYAQTPSSRIDWPSVAGASDPAENTTLCGENWLWRLQSGDSSLLNRLAGQAITAQLNQASGADLPASAADELSFADRALQDCSISAKETVDATRAILALARYNSGKLGVPTCSMAPTAPQVTDCGSAPDGTVCDDGNACTEGDSCWDGNCVQGNWATCDDANVCTTDYCDPAVGCVAQDTTTCEDGNACTDDKCDPAKGCTFTSDIGKACDDGNVCTEMDACNEFGNCGGGKDVICDDGDPCTKDYCEQSWGCLTSTGDNGVKCDDGDACTTTDECWEGKCVGADPLKCDDGNLCGTDFCDPAIGCDTKPANGLDCDDGNACTMVDACWDNKCAGSGAPKCDDGNVCTIDSCDPSVGCVYSASNGTPCTDGDACTLLDSCWDKGCVSGEPVDCNDGNVCTTDTCDTKLGCVNDNANGAECTDNSKCTVDDACWDAKCIPGDALQCDDGNVCTADSCDPAIGCINTPTEGTPCDDGDACTEQDSCWGGECSQSKPVDCADGNICTKDLCDSKTGCYNPNDSGAECDDGESCTIGDACWDGACKSGELKDCDDGEICTEDRCDNIKGCAYASRDKAACDDGNSCTEGDSCWDKTCKNGTQVNCDDGNVCTQDDCDPQTGCWNKIQNGVGCDDGDLCTSNDKCVDKVCVGEGEADCDDGNPCTVDTCTAGGCKNVNADGAACSDGNDCTTGDSCWDGDCKPGTALDCDDGNECTADSCWDGTCANTNTNGTACDDGDDCTTGDSCWDGTCSAAAEVQCDDGNVCTTDSCENGQCKYSNADGASCDDGDLCTQGDSCWDANCISGKPLDCDDGEICTEDTCGANGCVYTSDDGASCDDGNACTEGDSCWDSTCKNGGPVDCDDGNLCTQDDCDPNTGCWNKVQNGVGCDDGDDCTANDVCLDKECKGSGEADCDDGNPCTTDKCSTGGCVSINADGASCDDGDACTTGDSCWDGACKPGTALDCNDGNECTADSCGKDGCVNSNTAGTPCDDGDKCTGGDSCWDGACTPGTEDLCADPCKDLNCDDGNVCTDDSCSDGKCSNTNTAGTPCDDGDKCTGGDSCWDGACTPGTEDLCADPCKDLDCDDGEVCTTDTCWNGKCLHESADGAPCDDGNSCTEGDSCWDDTCKNGTQIDCDDDNVCTQDDCDPNTGCWNKVQNGVLCDDGDICTSNDVCLNKECVAGSTKDCDDGNPCTIDSCDPQGGCVNKNAEGASCEDGDLCTLEDSCWDGTCLAGDAKDCDDDNVCTKDSCDSGSGQCINGNDDGATCDDGDGCTTDDSCWDGDCKSGAPLDCDDDNVCTTDSCWNGKCANANADGATCTDGDACTVDDSCWDAKCISGKPTVCDDDNVCTTDSCNPASGKCEFGNDDGATCDDGNFCTVGDSCWDGDCKAGPEAACDDGNECTINTCDPTDGCSVKNADAKPCDDGDVCTVNDECWDARCVSGEAKGCDDGDDCTLDSCDPVTGCSYEENPLCTECLEEVDLGAAAGFNVFACGDYNGLQDSHGAVAVRGDFNAQGVNIGELRPGTDGLVVGGSANIKAGTIFGDVTVAGSIATQYLTVLDGNIQSGTKVQFKWECKSLIQTSTALAAHGINGQTEVTSWGGVFFRGNNPIVNVFSIDASDLAAANTVIMDVPAGAGVLINVFGQTAALEAMGLAGFEANRTLFNFPEATGLKIERITVPGTVLAPRANIWFNNGNIDGTLIGKNIEGNGEAHHVPLTKLEVNPCFKPSTDEAGSCSFRVEASTWGSGGQARVIITSDDHATSDWSVDVDFTADVDVLDTWVENAWWSGQSAYWDQTLTVESANAGNIGAGATFVIGTVFTGATDVKAVSVNGTKCSVE